MSVLVKSMKMPENCDECHFNEGPYCLAVEGVYCQAIYDGSVRHKQCPLIDIPPHGRLIDADVLKEVSHYDDHDMCVVDADDIDNAPTIISAEEGE